MAVLTTYNTTGIREDLADIIYNISPTETPFMSGVGKNKALSNSIRGVFTGGYSLISPYPARKHMSFVTLKGLVVHQIKLLLCCY